MIVPDESTPLPVLAELARIIVEQVRLTPKVLPVVRVLALGFVVIVREIWAPLRFKVVHVELVIFRQLVNKARLQIELRVSERADLPIGTVMRAARAKLRLVLFDVVQSLHVAVRHVTEVTELARLSLLVLAEVGRVDTILSAAIDLRVEELAHLVLVDATVPALGDLEHAQA